MPIVDLMVHLEKIVLMQQIFAIIKPYNEKKV
jgi:hypothetical protein